jgi:hypothetical protein
MITAGGTDGIEEQRDGGTEDTAERRRRGRLSRKRAGSAAPRGRQAGVHADGSGHRCARNDVGQQHHRVYDSGRELDWFDVGLSPRKQSLTLYITEGFDGYAELLGRLGKHSIGKSCLYIKRLSDVDQDVLEEIVTRSVARTRNG